MGDENKNEQFEQFEQNGQNGQNEQNEQFEQNGQNEQNEQNEQIKEQAVKSYTEKEFLSDLEWTSKSYVFCIVISALLVVASIVIAVHLRVSFGLIGAIFSVLVYIWFTGHILYSKLGFAYTSTTGALKITEIYGKCREEIWIPRRLLLLDVREIGDEACDHNSSSELRFIHLPNTITTIGNNVFAKCEKLECIFYEGSPEEWDAIEKGEGLESVKIVFFDKVAYPVKADKATAAQSDGSVEVEVEVEGDGEKQGREGEE